MLLAALIMFFEEWLWERLKAVMAAIGRLPFIRGLEARIAASSPAPAFTAPRLALRCCIYPKNISCARQGTKFA